MKKELKDQSIQELANATKTYYSVGGHTKAMLNKIRIKELKEELINKGIEIPSDEELIKIGKFNGKGSV